MEENSVSISVFSFTFVISVLLKDYTVKCVRIGQVLSQVFLNETPS